MLCVAVCLLRQRKLKRRLGPLPWLSTWSCRSLDAVFQRSSKPCSSKAQPVGSLCGDRCSLVVLHILFVSFWCIYCVLKNLTDLSCFITDKNTAQSQSSVIYVYKNVLFSFDWNIRRQDIQGLLCQLLFFKPLLFYISCFFYSALQLWINCNVGFLENFILMNFDNFLLSISELKYLSYLMFSAELLFCQSYTWLIKITDNYKF